MSGLGLVLLGLAARQNVVLCVVLGSIVAMLGLSGLLFVDELTVYPDGRWFRRRGFGPLVTSTPGVGGLQALVEKRHRVDLPSDDVRYNIVIRFENGPDLEIWPDDVLLRSLGLRSTSDKYQIAEVIDAKLNRVRVSV